MGGQASGIRPEAVISATYKNNVPDQINNCWGWPASGAALASEVIDRHPEQEKPCLLLGPLQHFARLGQRG